MTQQLKIILISLALSALACGCSSPKPPASKAPPQHRTTNRQSPQRVYVLVLSEPGMVSMHGKPVSFTRVPAALKEAGARPTDTIAIKVKPDARSADLQQLMDIVEKSGHNHISLSGDN